jgi:HK97 family phage prohead protease
MSTTADARRAAAQLRRRAAEVQGESGGDVAYEAFRRAAPGKGAARIVDMPTEFRAEQVQRAGKELTHTEGFFTRYDTGYPMWDDEGEYVEIVSRGAGAKTIAAKPDVAFLVNHAGTAMARTRNGTLVLEDRPEGGWHEAWLNPERQDVRDLVIAMRDGNMTEMSFAFMITDGMWSDDFMEFHIRGYDLDRGDVSAVTYGANPYTDIAARSQRLMRDLAFLPRGAQREAMARLSEASGDVPGVGIVRERVAVRSAPVVPGVAVAGSPSAQARRLRARLNRTADRMAALAGDAEAFQEIRAAKLPWYEMRSVSEPLGDGGDAGSVAEILIYDEIGGSFGVDAATFAEDLGALDATQLNVRINSPGGSVFDAVAIHSSLLHHPANVTVYVDAIAASAASVIAMAGDEIVMMPGSQLMIHDASSMFDGNAAEAAKLSTFLDRQSTNLAEMYARKAGGDPAEFRTLMQEETWMFAREAVALGLADRLGGDDPSSTDARMKRTFDLSHYRYAGRRAAPAPGQQLRADIGETQPEAQAIVRQALDDGLKLWDSISVPDEPDPQPVDEPVSPAATPPVDPTPVRPAPPEQPEEDQRSFAKIKRGRSIAFVESMIDADMI